MSERITIQDVQSWMSVNEIDDPDYLYYVMGLERARRGPGTVTVTAPVVEAPRNRPQMGAG